MKIYAPAKVNLALDVVSTYPNGYHELDMVMVPIDIFDEIEVKIAKEDKVMCLDMVLPEDNTISKMIRVCREQFQLAHCYEVHVKKDIPMQAGLAGGSADAAAVCKAILELENLNVSFDQQVQIAKQVGADVPFCLYNQWARVQGIGEVISPIQTTWKLKALLLKPDQGVSTPEAFKKWHSQEPMHPNVDAIQNAIEKEDLESLIQCMDNALEPCAFQLVPELESIKEEMLETGISRVLMSGSGSSLMGFSADEQVLIDAQKKLSDKYNFVRVITIG